jgi:hypothetical protein
MSDSTARFGASAKNIAPPPKNGSKYVPLEARFSRRIGTISFTSHRLPPGHFKNGFAAGLVRIVR